MVPLEVVLAICTSKKKDALSLKWNLLFSNKRKKCVNSLFRNHILVFGWPTSIFNHHTHTLGHNYKNIGALLGFIIWLFYSNEDSLFIVWQFYCHYLLNFFYWIFVKSDLTPFFQCHSNIIVVQFLQAVFYKQHNDGVFHK